MRNPGVSLSRETLRKLMWGQDFTASLRSLDVHVGSLRAKLEAGGEPRIARTVRGIGFIVRDLSALAHRVILAAVYVRRRRVWRLTPTRPRLERRVSQTNELTTRRRADPDWYCGKGHV